MAATFYLREIWPDLAMRSTRCSARRWIRRRTADSISDFEAQNPLWNEIPTSTGSVYQWDP